MSTHFLIFLSTHPPVYLFSHVHSYPSTCHPVYPYPWLPIHLSTCFLISLFTCQPVCMFSQCPSVHLFPIFLSNLSTSPAVFPVHVYMYPHVPAYMSTCVYLFFKCQCQPVHLSSCFSLVHACIPMFLPTCPPVYLFSACQCQTVHLSSCFPLALSTCSPVNLFFP